MNISDLKHCPKCNNVYPKKTGFYKNNARYNNYSAYCRICEGSVKITTKSRRELIIKLLGGKCVGIKKDGSVCGYEEDIRALQIDHIDGDGSLERIDQSYEKYIRHIFSNYKSGKYQVLCANCNAIKRHTNNEHGGGKNFLGIMPEPINGELRTAVLDAKMPGKFLTKFTPEIAREIRERLKNGEKAYKLAKEFKCSNSTISRIKNYSQYKN